MCARTLGYARDGGSFPSRPRQGCPASRDASWTNIAASSARTPESSSAWSFASTAPGIPTRARTSPTSSASATSSIPNSSTVRMSARSAFTTTPASERASRDAIDFIGGGTGAGLEENVRQAYRFLSMNYARDVEIYLFGFSRGAFTARSLAGYLGASGLLRPEHCTRENEDRAWVFYRTPPGDRYPHERLESPQADIRPRRADQMHRRIRHRRGARNSDANSAASEPPKILLPRRHLGREHRVRLSCPRHRRDARTVWRERLAISEP